MRYNVCALVSEWLLTVTCQCAGKQSRCVTSKQDAARVAMDVQARDKANSILGCCQPAPLHVTVPQQNLSSMGVCKGLNEICKGLNSFHTFVPLKLPVTHQSIMPTRNTPQQFTMEGLCSGCCHPSSLSNSYRCGDATSQQCSCDQLHCGLLLATVTTPKP